MTMPGSEMVAKVRALRAEAPSPEVHVAGLNELIGIGFPDVGADLDSVDAVFAMVTLRRRIRDLEARVRELEASK